MRRYGVHTYQLRQSVDRTPLNLYEALDPWAAKLGRLGLISTRLVESERDLDIEFDKRITADGKVRTLAHKIFLQREDEACFEIVLKATPKGGVAGVSEP